MILEVKNISKNFEFREHFGHKQICLEVLNNISFNLESGENLSILGQSGSGKSTLAKILALVIKQSDGEIFFEGKNLSNLNQNEVLRCRSRIRLVMQNQKLCLNPALKIKTQIKNIKNYLKLNFDDELVGSLLKTLNLPAEILAKLPHQISGGEAERVGMLIAMLSNPKLLILDEITSGLDFEAKERLLDMLLTLNKNINIIFITHDLMSARRVADKVLLLEKGKQIFFGDFENIKECPKFLELSEALSY
jgi:methionine import ATP-binding protein metN 2